MSSQEGRCPLCFAQEMQEELVKFLCCLLCAICEVGKVMNEKLGKLIDLFKKGLKFNIFRIFFIKIRGV